MKTGITARQLVFQTLDNRLELGGTTEFNAITNMSKHAAEKFCTDLLRDNAFKLKSPVAVSTINRYIEMWIKSKLSQ